MSNEALGFDQVHLQIGDGASPEVFTRACSVQSFDGPTKSRAAYDTSTLCDPAKTFRAGQAGNGTISLNMVREREEDDFDELDMAYDDNELINIRIVNAAVTPNTYIQFAALVTELKLYGVAIDQAVTATATLTVSGEITDGTVSP
jgi:hypothetical protein